MKTKLQTKNFTEHLHYGHLAIIVGCAVFLVGTMILKNGFDLSSLVARADSEGTETISYEEIKRQVAAESKVVIEDPDKLSDDIAMLDPGSQAGKVLGESIGFKVVEPNELATDPRFQSIKVLTTSGIQKSDIEMYALESLRIESENNGLLILAYLNSDDLAALDQAILKSQDIVTLLEQIYVPSHLESFHKMKIIYYKSLEQIARNFAGQQTNVSLQQATSDMFSAINAMSPIRTTIYSRYQVQI